MPKFISSLFCCGNKTNKSKKLTQQEIRKQEKDLVKSIYNNLVFKSNFLDSEAWHATQRMVKVDMFGISNILGWHVDLAFAAHEPAQELIDLLTPCFSAYINQQDPEFKDHEKSYLAIHMAHQILCSLFQVTFEKPSELLHTPSFPEDKLDQFRKKFWENRDEKSIKLSDVQMTNQAYEQLILETIKKIGPQQLFNNAYNDWLVVETKMLEQQRLLLDTMPREPEEKASRSLWFLP